MGRALFLLLFWGVAVFAGDLRHFDAYRGYLSKINLIHKSVQGLEKNAEATDYSGVDLYGKLGRNSALIMKFCSESYESQMYFNGRKEVAQTQGIDLLRDQYFNDLESQRKDVYTMCKNMKGVMQRLSLHFKKQDRPKGSQVVMDQHNKLWENLKRAYQEIDGIEKALSNRAHSRLTKQRHADFYTDFRQFSCDYEKEQKSFASVQNILRNEIQRESSRAPAADEETLTPTEPSSSAAALEQLKKRHQLFETICSQIQSKKENIEKMISDQGLN